MSVDIGRTLLRIGLGTTALTFAFSSAAAQRGFGGACNFSWDSENYFVSPFFRGNPAYEGRVKFARIKYAGSYECGREGPGWAVGDCHGGRRCR